MCECGCTSNDTRYTMPGPGKSLYLISLQVACEGCDVGPGIRIEHIQPGHVFWDEFKQGEFIDGPLPFEKWAHNPGVLIDTGMRKCQFVEALKRHLIGVSAEEMGDDGVIDESGAEVLLEEMWNDSQVQPTVVEPQKTDRK